MNIYKAALILLIIGFVIVFSGYTFLYRGTDQFTIRQLVNDLYANGGAELLSISITVLIIENLNIKRDEQNRKEELIFQMGSDEAVTAKAAARMLSYKGWLKDGSIIGANLNGANLQNGDFNYANFAHTNLTNAKLMLVHFEDANLQKANLTGSDLFGAHLKDANLENANLQYAFMEEADLSYTNLQNADLSGANLQAANLKYAKIENAKWQYKRQSKITVLRTAILPDGSEWTQDTDLEQFTNPEHPNFWSPSTNS